jgi:hypothetical protein
VKPAALAAVAESVRVASARAVRASFMGFPYQ